MKVGLYAVLDNCTGVYDGPVPAHNDATAMRNFAHMAQNPEGPIGKNPSDFSLWWVGTYNDATGEIDPQIKKCLLHAIDVITPNNEVELNA